MIKKFLFGGLEDLNVKKLYILTKKYVIFNILLTLFLLCAMLKTQNVDNIYKCRQKDKEETEWDVKFYMRRIWMSQVKN